MLYGLFRMFYCVSFAVFRTNVVVFSSDEKAVTQMIRIFLLSDYVYESFDPYSNDTHGLLLNHIPCILIGPFSSLFYRERKKETLFSDIVVIVILPSRLSVEVFPLLFCSSSFFFLFFFMFLFLPNKISYYFRRN